MLLEATNTTYPFCGITTPTVTLSPNIIIKYVIPFIHEKKRKHSNFERRMELSRCFPAQLFLQNKSISRKRVRLLTYFATKKKENNPPKSSSIFRNIVRWLDFLVTRVGRFPLTWKRKCCRRHVSHAKHMPSGQIEYVAMSHRIGEIQKDETADSCGKKVLLLIGELL